jgi:hypothetical protein
MLFCFVEGENSQRSSLDSNFGTMCHWNVRITYYQLGHAPLLESLLEMKVSKCVYEDGNK